MYDLTHLKLATTKANGVSYGCYYKASEVVNGTKYYYKCSNFYSGLPAFGDESLYEVICSRLFERLGFRHTKYVLLRARVYVEGSVHYTYLCKSADFSKGFTSRMTFGDYVTATGYTVTNAIQHAHLYSSICQMLVADFLTIQRDRHENNMEILNKQDGTMQLAPLFDNGLSFFAPLPACYPDSHQRVKDFDPMTDVAANNYIGARSLLTNLNLIRSPVRVRRLDMAKLDSLFYGMSKLLPDFYREKIKEIIRTRYEYLKCGGYIIET